MKKFKLGFTLAEVLITLGIIGVVAAIVMPTVMSSYQYSTVGVKLAKFAASTENAARAYVAMNGAFGVGTTTETKNAKGEVTKTEHTEGAGSMNFMKDTYMTLVPNATWTAGTASSLKDGTAVTVYAGAPTAAVTIDPLAVGNAAFKIRFSPNITGLPSTAQHNFDFIVTELGYVYPSKTDNCLLKIYNGGYKTTKPFFMDTANKCNKVDPQAAA